MAQAGLEHEIEFSVVERHIDDRAKLVELRQRLRRAGVDRAIVLDTPRINSAIAQRCHQFSAGRSGHQELVTLPVPDDLDEVRQIRRIGKPVPGLTIGTEPAIILEIPAIDPVRRTLAASAAQLHHLGDNDVGGGVGGIEQSVQRRIEQIVPDHDQAWMLLRIGPVIGHDVARRQAAGQRIHRREPATGLALQEMRARIAERSRERLQGGVDQFLIAEIGESQRVGTGDQPVQHAVLADVVARAFVVNAASAERFRHEPGARDFLSPKRLVEQDRNS